MKLINDLLRPVFDLLQGPLAGLPAFVGILLWSIPVGVFALWIFGKTSNQERIAEVKRRIHAGLFEIRLFNDDLRAIMRAQGEILRHVLHYQALALKPMIFILPPTEKDLSDRLNHRGRDAGEATEERLNGASAEIAAAWQYYKHMVINEDLQQAVSEVVDIIQGPL